MDEGSITPRESAEANWLILSNPDNPPIRLDVRILDRILLIDEHLILEVDDVAIRLQVSGGAGSENSDLIRSGNSDHSGMPSGTRGPSIATTNKRGGARNDRHGQKTR